MKNLDSILNQVKNIGYEKEQLTRLLNNVLKEAIEDCFLEKTGSHAGKVVVEEIFDIVKSNSNYPKCNDADIEIAVNNWLVSIKEDDNATIEDGVLSRYFDKTDKKERVKKDIEKIYELLFLEKPEEIILENILEFVIREEYYFTELDISSLEKLVKKWILSAISKKSLALEERKDYLKDNTCDHCGGEAVLETENPSQTSGDVCDVCGKWVCQDCLDHSKCGVDYDNVCQKCSKEMVFQEALDNLEQVKKDYYSDGLRHQATAFAHASAMADAINDLLRTYNN